MAKARPTKMVKTVLEKYGLDPESSCWDCHGTLVVYHKACQIIAMQSGIEFNLPVIVQSEAEKGIVIILVEGTMPLTEGGQRHAWSFGEATPKNNKNAYPFAMAEKRAKDRIILALAGIHGYVYSEMEADDFRNSKPEPVEVKESPPQENSSRLIDWVVELNTALIAIGCDDKVSADQVCRWLWENAEMGIDECRSGQEKARDTIYKMDEKVDGGIGRTEFIEESKEYKE